MVLRVTVVLLLGACFNPDLSTSELRCDTTNLCPFGQVCTTDGICRSPLDLPDASGGTDGPIVGDDASQNGCPDQDLGSMLGAPVATGDLDDFDDDVRGCMSGGGANDATFGWVAPADGQFRFTTCGSRFDSVLFIEDDCDGNQLACDDDSCPTGMLQEQIDLDLTAGQSIVIVVGGFDGERGTFELNIEQL